MTLVECLLHGVESAVGTGQPFDGRDLGSVGLDREHRAALHAHAVQVDGARAAVGGVAADDRAHLSDAVAEIVDEQDSGLDIVLVPDSVDGDADPGHLFLLCIGDPAIRRDGASERAGPRHVVQGSLMLPIGHPFVAHASTATLGTARPRRKTFDEEGRTGGGCPRVSLPVGRSCEGQGTGDVREAE